ncbi:MAG: formyltransferase family protein, partial [Paracoccaceae bacterium]
YDLGIIYAYGKLVPKDIIEHSKFGIMNLHCSLLPSYRGAAPIQHALINGEDYTGYTYFRINELLDEGDIILQEKYKILQSDNCLSIQFHSHLEALLILTADQ